MDPQKALHSAKNMLQNKNLNGVCLNILQDASSFGSDTNEVEFLTQTQQLSIPKAEKLLVALQILAYAQTLEG
jgi:phosphopantothenoylcysteine decarboxylase/phosphopantothenate--cysteine ligase